MTSLRYALVPLSALILLLAAYALAQAATGPAVTGPNVKEIVVEARQFSYRPEVIQVAEGERVRLTLKAMDVTHGLYIDDYGIELHAAPGTPEQIEFVASKSGTVRFRCTQTCGALHPFMVGKLQVGDSAPFNYGLGALGVLTLGVLGALWLRQSLPAGQPAAPAWPVERYLRGPNLLGVGLLNRWLRWRGFQFSLILPLLAFLVVAIVAGIRGTPVGSHNISIVFVWIIWWPLLIVALIPFGGRIWCAVCPLPAPGEWLQRLALVGKRGEVLLGLGKRWPRALRNMWLQNGAFVFIALFSAVILTMPFATAMVLGLFFVSALVLALVYTGRSFCRYVCPLGGFIGLCSLAAPLAVRVKDSEVCRCHKGKECVRGSAEGYGCPWFEYPGTMQRNAYCGLCMECVKTCPKNNIAVALQPFGHDLAGAKPRLDEAYRTFIALGSAGLYAAVMLGPWGWLKTLAGNPLSPGFLLYASLLFAVSLVVVPGGFLATAYLSRLAGPIKELSTVRLWTSLSYGLVPLALMAWIAFSLGIVFVSGHYVVPVVSDPLGHGWNLLGTAGFEGRPLLMGLLPYLQIAAMSIGLLWSLRVSWHLLSRQLPKQRALRALLPVAAFLALSAATFLWLYVG